jgi:hypothetical protein
MWCLSHDDPGSALHAEGLIRQDAKEYGLGVFKGIIPASV